VPTLSSGIPLFPGILRDFESGLSVRLFVSPGFYFQDFSRLLVSDSRAFSFQINQQMLSPGDPQTVSLLESAGKPADATVTGTYSRVGCYQWVGNPLVALPILLKTHSYFARKTISLVSSRQIRHPVSPI
jgi:hypothetical protein